MAGPGPDELRVGTLRGRDAGEVLTLQRAAYVTEAQRYREPDIAPLRETLDELRADLESSTVLGYGAWLDRRLVGAVRGRPAGAQMEICRFVVAPDLQGRGIGRALLSAVHSAAPQHIATFWLVTGARSDDNLRLYTSVGYRTDSAATDSAGVALVRMVRPARVAPAQVVDGTLQ